MPTWRPWVGEASQRHGRLLTAGLDEHPAARSEPAVDLARDPAMKMKSIAATLQRDPRFMVASLCWHETNLVRRHIRRVSHHIHPAPQPRG